MYRTLFFTLITLLPYFAKSQQNTFNEVFQTFGLYDITELPNGDFFFIAPRHGQTEHWGIRAYRLDNVGSISDTFSFWISDHDHWPGRHNHQLLIPEDTTMITFWRYGNSLIGFESYITKWQIYPNIDTIQSEKLSLNYPSLNSFLATQTIRSQDGNILSSGNISDTTNPQVYVHAHIAKYDLNLNVLWETRVQCTGCPLGASAISVVEEAYGRFVVAGSSVRSSGMPNSVTRTWIAKADSTGMVEWEHLFPIHNNDNRLSDGFGNLTLSADGKIMMASMRAFDCPDFDPNCDFTFPLARIRLMKFDWDGTILKDTVIGPLTRMDGITSLQPAPNGGYIITGVRKGGAYNSLVFRISEEGDSIWWREPYIGDQRNDNHWSYQTKPTADGGYIGCGMNVLHIGTHPWGHPQAGYVYKLDSNGCFGPGDCPTSTISVTEYEEEAGLSFYPNPTNDVLNVTYSIGNGKLHTVVIRDLQGKTLREEPLQNNGNEHTARLELQDLPNGMYLLEIRNQGRVEASAKVNKQ